MFAPFKVDVNINIIRYRQNITPQSTADYNVVIRYRSIETWLILCAGIEWCQEQGRAGRIHCENLSLLLLRLPRSYLPMKCLWHLDHPSPSQCHVLQAPPELHVGAQRKPLFVKKTDLCWCIAFLQKLDFFRGQVHEAKCNRFATTPTLQSIPWVRRNPPKFSLLL